MRPLLLGVIALPLALACGPVPEAEDASGDERPCRTQQDCEIADTTTEPHTHLCSSRAVLRASRDSGPWDTSARDSAACGPMPYMTPTIREPRLACFHGTCVPIASR